MDWKASLDRYLTTPPEDCHYDNYFESVVEHMTDRFYYENEDWVLESELCNDWCIKLYNDGKMPIQTAKIIEKAHGIFVNYVDN